MVPARVPHKFWPVPNMDQIVIFKSSFLVREHRALELNDFQ